VDVLSDVLPLRLGLLDQENHVTPFASVDIYTASRVSPHFFYPNFPASLVNVVVSPPRIHACYTYADLRYFFYFVQRTNDDIIPRGNER
jgi:hypothetical protein